MMRLLGLSGSLRAASIDTALLHAASELVPAGVELSVYQNWGTCRPSIPMKRSTHCRRYWPSAPRWLPPMVC